MGIPTLYINENRPLIVLLIRGLLSVLISVLRLKGNGLSVVMEPLSDIYRIASAISLSSLRISTFLARFNLNLPSVVQSSSSVLKSNVPAFSEEYMMIDLNGIV